MKILKQICIIFVLCIIGEVISTLMPFPFSGSVVSMILLFVLLLAKIIKKRQIEEVSNYFMLILSFLFVSPTVSIINYYDILKNILIQFILICIISAIITFTVTAYTVTFIIYLRERKK